MKPFQTPRRHGDALDEARRRAQGRAGVRISRSAFIILILPTYAVYERTSERCDERALPLFTSLPGSVQTAFSMSTMMYILFLTPLDEFYLPSEFRITKTIFQFLFFLERLLRNTVFLNP